MEIRKVSVERLNPAAYNPRKDLQPGDAAYEKLKSSIEVFGNVQTIVWNERSGNVVGGHQRLKVLIERGEREIDCTIVDLDDEREKVLNIALNKIQGEWDDDKLAALLAELDEAAFDVSLT
jgi:ParB-like chromosome segregation protein Spo0J